MIALGSIKKWITDTLSTSTEFTDYCTTTVGSKLNFYRSTPVHKVVETPPFMTVYGVGTEDDRENTSGYQENWTVPITIGIEETEDAVEDANGVKVWESSEKVELIKIKMMEVLDKEIRCGINSDYIRILNVQTFLTEIGEADDVEAQVFITFGKQKDI